MDAEHTDHAATDAARFLAAQRAAALHMTIDERLALARGHAVVEFTDEDTGATIREDVECAVDPAWLDLPEGAVDFLDELDRALTVADLSADCG